MWFLALYDLPMKKSKISSGLNSVRFTASSRSSKVKTPRVSWLLRWVWAEGGEIALKASLEMRAGVDYSHWEGSKKPVLPKKLSESMQQEIWAKDWSSTSRLGRTSTHQGARLPKIEPHPQPRDWERSQR